MSETNDLFEQRRLILVASDALADADLVAGVSDVGIKASSRAHYAALRDALGEVPDDTVWLTSAVHRARQTASRLFPNQTWTEDAFLSARSQGEWEGLTWRGVREAHPIACEAYWNALGRTRAPGGETLNEVRNRVTHFLAGIANQPDHGHVIAVTHAIILQVAIAHIMDAPLRHVLRVEAGPLASLHLVSGWSGWRIEALHAH